MGNENYGVQKFDVQRSVATHRGELFDGNVQYTFFDGCGDVQCGQAARS